jgi:hypothetical protein
MTRLAEKEILLVDLRHALSREDISKSEVCRVLSFGRADRDSILIRLIL